jgi:hypothetical protein
LIGVLHTPVDGLQDPATWHSSIAAQFFGLLPTQVPAWHWSVWVQAFPSPHGEPVSGLPSPQHAFDAIGVPLEQQTFVTGVPEQTPLVHLSAVVHALPSAHELPLAFLVPRTHIPEVKSQV